MTPPALSCRVTEEQARGQSGTNGASGDITGGGDPSRPCYERYSWRTKAVVDVNARRIVRGVIVVRRFS